MEWVCYEVIDKYYMAYDTYQAERILSVFEQRNLDFYQKKMFSGMIFMLNDKMCVGTHIDKRSEESLLMIRIGSEAYEKNKDRCGCKPMDYTGRPMRDYSFITPEGYDSERDLAYWVDLAIAFNPYSKASKKRKKR